MKETDPQITQITQMWNGRIASVRLLAIFLVFAACGNAAGEADEVRVVRVTDGDTIVVRGEGAEERVRLFGIDAPEMNYGRGRPDCGAREATEALRGRLDGKRVRLERRGKDDYGRTLAIVRDEANVNLWLLEQGHAEVFRKARHRDAKRFRTAETEARKASRGMWRCRHPERSRNHASAGASTGISIDTAAA